MSIQSLPKSEISLKTKFEAKNQRIYSTNVSLQSEEQSDVFSSPKNVTSHNISHKLDRNTSKAFKNPFKSQKTPKSQVNIKSPLFSKDYSHSEGSEHTHSEDLSSSGYSDTDSEMESTFKESFEEGQAFEITLRSKQIAKDSRLLRRQKTPVPKGFGKANRR